MAASAPATAGEHLRLELRFPFELKKQISCSIQLSNHSDDFIAFKVKTTSPKKYSVRPNTGVVSPRSTCDVIVTMQAQRKLHQICRAEISSWSKELLRLLEQL